MNQPLPHHRILRFDAAAPRVGRSFARRMAIESLESRLLLSGTQLDYEIWNLDSIQSNYAVISPGDIFTLSDSAPFPSYDFDQPPTDHFRWLPVPDITLDVDQALDLSYQQLQAAVDRGILAPQRGSELAAQLRNELLLSSRLPSLPVYANGLGVSRPGATVSLFSGGGLNNLGSMIDASIGNTNLTLFSAWTAGSIPTVTGIDFADIPILSTDFSPTDNRSVFGDLGGLAPNVIRTGDDLASSRSPASAVDTVFSSSLVRWLDNPMYREQTEAFDYVVGSGSPFLFLSADIAGIESPWQLTAASHLIVSGNTSPWVEFSLEVFGLGSPDKVSGDQTDAQHANRNNSAPNSASANGGAIDLAALVNSIDDSPIHAATTGRLANPGQASATSVAAAPDESISGELARAVLFEVLDAEAAHFAYAATAAGSEHLAVRRDDNSSHMKHALVSTRGSAQAAAYDRSPHADLRADRSRAAAFAQLGGASEEPEVASHAWLAATPLLAVLAAERLAALQRKRNEVTPPANASQANP